MLCRGKTEGDLGGLQTPNFNLNKFERLEPISEVQVILKMLQGYCASVFHNICGSKFKSKLYCVIHVNFCAEEDAGLVSSKFTERQFSLKWYMTFKILFEFVAAVIRIHKVSVCQA